MKLKEGEIICNKCNGSGSLSSKINASTMAFTCKKCDGVGKLDWIENVIGKKVPNMFDSSSTMTISGMKFSNYPIKQKDLNKMSKRLADKIDKEILESFLLDSEQKTNKMKAAATVFKKLGGIFDNRIIS